jgi:hypothetical protein
MFFLLFESEVTLAEKLSTGKQIALYIMIIICVRGSEEHVYQSRER